MTTLARRFGTGYLFLVGGTLLVATIAGAAIAYALASRLGIGHQQLLLGGTLLVATVVGAAIAYVLAKRLGTGYLLLLGGTLVMAITMGAVIAYPQRFPGGIGDGDFGPYRVVGAFLVAVIVIAILWQWRLSVAVMAAVLPVEGAIKAGSVASGIKVLGLLMFFSLAVGFLVEQKLFERFLRLCQQPLTLTIFLFVLWTLFSTLWASNQEAAWTKVGTFLGVSGLMIVVGMLEERYLVLAWVVMTLSTVAAVPGAFVIPSASTHLVTDKLYGTGLFDANDWACFLVIIFFIAYFGLRRYRILAYALAPVLLIGTFTTQSRTGLIVLVVTPLLAAILVPRLAARLGSRTLLMYGLGLVFLVGIVLAFPSLSHSSRTNQTVLERYSSLTEYNNESTWSGRWSLWEGASQVIASHPILGVGAGNYGDAAVKHSEQVAMWVTSGEDRKPVAHDMFLSVTSEMGFVGLALFLGVLFFAFKAALPISQRSALGTGILLGLIAFTIAGTSLTWEDHKIGYVLLGSILSLGLQAARQGKPVPDEQENPA